MSEPFLILHKVRDEPAFDIAEKLPCPECVTNEYVEHMVVAQSNLGCDECSGSGFWWIIPTSGHRAYPYWNMLLHNALDDIHYGTHMHPDDIPLPEGWPDHYPSKSSPPPPSLSTIMSSILNTITPKLRR